MSKLIDNIKYVEQHAGDGEVVSITKYHARQIFQTEGGLFWLIKKIAGVEGFRSLTDAIKAIDETPDKYPTNVTTVITGPFEQVYGRQADERNCRF